MRTAVALATILVLLDSTASFTQGRRGGARGGGGRGAALVMDESGTLLLLTALLDLSDSQRQQMRVAFDAASNTAAPIAVQTESAKDAFFQAAKSGKSDDEIRSMANQQGSRTSQLLVLQAQTFSKLWAVLTDEQKSKVDASMYADVGEFLSTPHAPVASPPIRQPVPAGPGN